MIQKVQYQDLGKISYKDAWDYQFILQKEVIDAKLAARKQLAEVGEEQLEEYVPLHHLLFCEHNPVYTLGKSGSMDNLLLTEAQLREKGIQFFPINRGGDITFHGPGQIVGYPILDLECFFTQLGLCQEQIVHRAAFSEGINGRMFGKNQRVLLRIGAGR